MFMPSSDYQKNQEHFIGPYYWLRKDHIQKRMFFFLMFLEGGFGKRGVVDEAMGLV